MSYDEIEQRAEKLPLKFRQDIRFVLNVAAVSPLDALVRIRVYLEDLITKFYSTFQEYPKHGKFRDKTLATLLHKLLSDGHIPGFISNHAMIIQKWGNHSAHPNSGHASAYEVAQCLSSFISIVDWYVKADPNSLTDDGAKEADFIDALLLALPSQADFAEQLKSEVNENFVQCAIQSIQIPSNDEQIQVLTERLRRCRSCILCLGDSGEFPWRDQEIRNVLENAEVYHGVEIIPVISSSAERPEKSLVPEFIRTTRWIKYELNKTSDPGNNQLSRRIFRSDDFVTLKHKEKKVTSPYRGLRFFDVEHSDLYWGREARIEWLLEKITPRKSKPIRSRFMAVVGASGSGKSSLARAGLAASLKAGEVAESENWPILIMQPGRDPVLNLSTALLGCETLTSPELDIANVYDRLLQDNRRLHFYASQATASQSDTARLVLIVDQFEELFTQCRDEELQQGFLNALCYAATAPGGRCYIILTMRDDFMGRCAEFPDLEALLSGNTELIPSMTSSELRRAIINPAKIAGGNIQYELADVLIRDMENQSGALPLMQHVLEQLWKYRNDDDLTLKEYNDIGGLKGALERHANRVYDSLEGDQKTAARQIFLRLTRPGDTPQPHEDNQIHDTKRTVPLSELKYGKDALVDSVIGILSDERLVVTLGGGTGSAATFVEVAHEALIRSWPRLREWIDEDRESLRFSYELSSAMRQWNQNDRKVGYLLHSDKLREMIEWADSVPNFLTALEDQFVQESVRNLVNNLSKRSPSRFQSALVELQPFLTRSEEFLKAIVSGSERFSSRWVFGVIALHNEAFSSAADLTSYICQSTAIEAHQVQLLLPSPSSELINGVRQILLSEGESSSARLNAAVFLAGYLNLDHNLEINWDTVSTCIAREIVFSVEANPADYATLQSVFEPLAPIFRKEFRKLAFELSNPYSKSWATQLLADFSISDPSFLAACVLQSDDGQFSVLMDNLKSENKIIREVANDVLSRSLNDEVTEEAKENLAQEQSRAILMQLALDESPTSWNVLKKSEDERARTRVIHELASNHAALHIILSACRLESDISVKSALIQTLGEFEYPMGSSGERQQAIQLIEDTFRNATDAAMRSSCEWSLRRLNAHLPSVNNSDAGTSKSTRNWSVAKNHHTMISIEPIDFLMGSTGSDPDGQPGEAAHLRKLRHRFELASMSTTRSQYEKFQKDADTFDLVHTEYIRTLLKTDDTPITYVTWYEVAQYCNWMSEISGIPEEEWCFSPNAEGEYGPGMFVRAGYLERAGYRMPLEAEWEFACRAGTTTRRFFGHSNLFLPKYAWFNDNTEGFPKPVGLLKPNPYGFFDILGGVWNWCVDEFYDYDQIPQKYLEDILVDNTSNRVLRGGGYVNVPAHVRTACRNTINKPDARFHPFGFRIARSCSS